MSKLKTSSTVMNFSLSEIEFNRSQTITKIRLRFPLQRIPSSDGLLDSFIIQRTVAIMWKIPLVWYRPYLSFELHNQVENFTGWKSVLTDSLWLEKSTFDTRDVKSTRIFIDHCELYHIVFNPKLHWKRPWYFNLCSVKRPKIDWIK